MIKINVAEIKKRLVGEKSLDLNLSPDDLELSTAELPLLGSVKVKGKISNAGDVLLLRVVLKGQVQRTCGRCLKEFTADTKAELIEKFYPASTEDIESDALVYTGDDVDVTTPLREGLLLAEPLQALCKPDCRGLCPVCGADLNDGECGCDRFTGDPRLAALKQFIKC